MFFSLIVYTFTAAIAFALTWHFYVRQACAIKTTVYKQLNFDWEVVATVLLIAVVAALRWGTGYDYVAYYNQYMTVVDTGHFTRHNYEMGFVWITQIFAACHAHFSLYFGFWSLLQLTLLYFGLRERAHLLPWLSLALVLNIWYLHFMNSIRQGVVECAFVALVPMIAHRRFWCYVVAILLVSLIHRAALLLLPVYLLCYLPSNRPRQSLIALAVLAICVVIGLKPVWLVAFKPLFNLVGHIGFDSWYQDNVAEIFAGNFRWVSFGPARIMRLMIIIIIIIHYSAIRRYFKDDALLPIYFFVMFIGESMHQALINTSFYILRPTELLTISTLVMIAYTCSFLWQTHRRWMLLILLALTITYIPIEIFKATFIPTDTNIQVLYHLFFC